MLDEDFNKARARLVRDLASRADPFIRSRLLALADRYETADGKLHAAHPHAVVTAADPASAQRNHLAPATKQT
jgi:hypothetical protein